MHRTIGKGLLTLTLAAMTGCQKEGAESFSSDIFIRPTVTGVSDTKAEAGDYDGTQIAAIPISEDPDDSLYLIVYEKDMPDRFMDVAATRGTEVTEDNLDLFYIKAYAEDDWHDNETNQNFSAGEYFDATEVTLDSGSWEMADEYDWLNNVPLSLWSWNAVEPEVDPADGYDKASFSYSLLNSVTSQEDLIFAYNGENRKFDRTGAITEKTSTNTAYNRTDNEVDVHFYHALSAIKFDISGVQDGQSVDQITIGGVASSGDCEITVSGGVPEFEWDNLGTAGSYSQTFTSTDFDTDGKQVTGGSKEFFMIPQALTDAATLTVTFDGTASTPKAIKAGGVEWKAGKYYTYKLSKTGASYTFTVDVDELVFDNTYDALTKSIYTVSYKESNSDPSVKEAVGYKAYTSTDGGTTWENFSAYSVAATYLQKSNSGSTTATERKIREAEKNSEIIPTYFWKDDTVEAVDWDLSRCGIGGEGYSASNPQNTANCYIVKHPGSYKFPCVYGNAIKNGATNSSSYSTATTGSYHTLLNMVNANGDGISNPYILTDMGLGSSTSVKASLLWTDRNTDVGLLIQNVEYSNNYISFETCDKDNLAEGNAVIVLYNDLNSDGSYTEGEGLWSWQIWVSHNDLGNSNVATVTDSHGTQHSFMSRDLGFQTGEKRKYYDKDTYLIKLVQDGSNLEKVITVRCPGATIILPGYCTFYQYGRPTAFPGPSKYFNDQFGKVTVYGPSGSVITSIKGDDTPFASVTSGTELISKFISYPNLAATAEKRPNPSALRYYTNLWSANLATVIYGYSYLSNLPSVTKTVYDPSPYGYCVPNPQAFSYLIGGEVHRNYSTDASLMNCEYDGDDDKRCTFILDADRKRIGDVKFLLGGYMSNFDRPFHGANIWSTGYYQTTAIFQNDYDYGVDFDGGRGGAGLSYTSLNDGLLVHPVLE